MTHEFDLVRATFAASWPGRLWASLRLIGESAWRTSGFRTAVKSAVANAPRTASALTRTIAIAIAVAAAMQPPLISMMPLVVRPTVPLYVFTAIAALAAAAAWRADDIADAWPESRVARWLWR